VKPVQSDPSCTDGEAVPTERSEWFQWEILAVPWGTGKQASRELVQRLGTEVPLAVRCESGW